MIGRVCDIDSGQPDFFWLLNRLFNLNVSIGYGYGPPHKFPTVNILRVTADYSELFRIVLHHRHGMRHTACTRQPIQDAADYKEQDA
jgi:hypothetical protein